MKKIHLAVGLLAFSMTAPVPAVAQTSPVFGSAKAERMSVTDAKSVKAKGVYANYYGSIANDQAYTAYFYGYYARWYAVANSSTEQSWYYTAHVNATDASNNYYYAYLMSFYGY